MTSTLVRSLLERALYGLERGWNAAAHDAIGRALAVDSDRCMRGIVKGVGDGTHTATLRSSDGPQTKTEVIDADSRQVRP